MYRVTESIVLLEVDTEPGMIAAELTQVLSEAHRGERRNATHAKCPTQSPLHGADCGFRIVEITDDFDTALIKVSARIGERHFSGGALQQFHFHV